MSCYEDDYEFHLPDRRIDQGASFLSVASVPWERWALSKPLLHHAMAWFLFGQVTQKVETRLLCKWMDGMRINATGPSIFELADSLTMPDCTHVAYGETFERGSGQVFLVTGYREECTLPKNFHIINVITTKKSIPGQQKKNARHVAWS